MQSINFPGLRLPQMRLTLPPSWNSSSKTLAQARFLQYVSSCINRHLIANPSKQCIPLLETALQAAKSVGIPNERIFILDMPKEFSGGKSVPFKTVGQLIDTGSKLPKLEALKWEKGQGARQCAYLCYSSGTSGLPVSILHSMSPQGKPNPAVEPNFANLSASLERCHDQPPKCDRKRYANGHL